MDATGIEAALAALPFHSAVLVRGMAIKRSRLAPPGYRMRIGNRTVDVTLPATDVAAILGSLGVTSDEITT